jgi:hypothetical protein
MFRVDAGRWRVEWEEEAAEFPVVVAAIPSDGSEEEEGRRKMRERRGARAVELVGRKGRGESTVLLLLALAGWRRGGSSRTRRRKLPMKLQGGETESSGMRIDRYEMIESTTEFARSTTRRDNGRASRGLRGRKRRKKRHFPFFLVFSPRRRAWKTRDGDNTVS